MKARRSMLFVSFLLTAVLVAACSGTTTTSVSAARQQNLTGPCEYVYLNYRDNGIGLKDFANPPEVRFTPDKTNTLAVEYTDPAKTKLGGCDVRLRSYNGQLVGPTIRAKPGETIDFTLDNRLPIVDPAADIKQETDVAHLAMTPNDFNTTNIHTHGLHVSPQGEGDNVLRAIGPQTQGHYKIEVPANHPPGTFWYHAHAHGSTSIQVGSGMVGALIIDDPDYSLPPSLAAATEQVMVIEQILYDTRGEANNILAFFPDSERGKALCEAKSDACTWQNSQRRTTINGQIVPKITMRPGEVQRWRMIDATFRESLDLQLQGHELHEIALDGLYLPQVDSWGSEGIEMESGYRSDILVKASDTPGEYKLIDAKTPATEALKESFAGESNTVAEDQMDLAIVEVKGDPIDMPLLTDEEMKEYNLPYEPDTDLRAQATGLQKVEFSIGNDMMSSPQKYFQVNGHSFTETQTRYVKKDNVDAWRLSTVGDPEGVPSSGEFKERPFGPVPHVFHIHINPFQTYRVGPDDSQERVWRDTLLVPDDVDPIFVYTRYDDFTGKFVMHCHILDHEDLGMMEAVEVVDELPVTMHQPH